jgi:hypothetical protein
MIDKKERIKSLRELSKLSYGKALKEYLADKLVDLNDLNKINNYEEYQAKKEAKKILLEIFKFLNLTETQIKEQSKNNYL